MPGKPTSTVIQMMLWVGSGEASWFGLKMGNCIPDDQLAVDLPRGDFSGFSADTWVKLLSSSYTQGFNSVIRVFPTITPTQFH